MHNDPWRCLCSSPVARNALGYEVSPIGWNDQTPAPSQRDQCHLSLARPDDPYAFSPFIPYYCRINFSPSLIPCYGSLSGSSSKSVARMSRADKPFLANAPLTSHLSSFAYAKGGVGRTGQAQREEEKGSEEPGCGGARDKLGVGTGFG